VESKRGRIRRVKYGTTTLAILAAGLRIERQNVKLLQAAIHRRDVRASKRFVGVFRRSADD
jgi:hypothetical protein